MASWMGSHSVKRSFLLFCSLRTSSRMSRLAVMEALQRGSTTTVLMSSISMAGPGTSWPGCRSLRR